MASREPQRAENGWPDRGGVQIEGRDLLLTGRVQGVGFRPFVHRLAVRHALAGNVSNLAGQVRIHVEGPPDALSRFEQALLAEAPPLARAVIAQVHAAAVSGASGFVIGASKADAAPDVHIPPDQSLCPDCLAELGDPRDRRHRHPFITCTQCGPRYTLIEAMPYDRANTSMADFPLCPACRAEYERTEDRRFHAEPLSCFDCGPRLAFARGGGVGGPRRAEAGEPALSAALAILRGGGILALKGVGGYHLMCDAADDAAVSALRARKHRPDKPLAVMVPQSGTDGLAHARACVLIDAVSGAALLDPARPIVLLPRSPDCRLSRHLAPGLGELGVMLPYSPLHHLLIAGFGAPLVATSGNISGEPVLTDPAEAESRLGAIADGFLHHDRRIVRPADDPVVRIIAGAARAIRLGRGTAPIEVPLPLALSEPLLALGGQDKVTLALGVDGRAIVSPHIGDLATPRGFDLMTRLAADLPRLYRVTPRRIVCDLHPGYASTRFGARQGLPVVPVQHHAAHASALAAEHPGISRWLTFAWDGVGYGADGTLWGGEAMLGAPGDWRRVASFRTFRPPGGDLAAREPWRAAAALLWETGRELRSSGGAAHELVRTAWRKGINAPPTSAVGRLFDAAASLVAGIGAASFEGQGAMQLEHLAACCPPDARGADGVSLPRSADAEGVLRCDWSPLVDYLSRETLPPEVRARGFHATMASALAEQVRVTAEHATFEAVGLTGGVFQNRVLAEEVVARLAGLGYKAFLPSLAPANDGGLALGQIVEAAASIAREKA